MVFQRESFPEIDLRQNIAFGAASNAYGRMVSCGRVAAKALSGIETRTLKESGNPFRRPASKRLCIARAICDRTGGDSDDETVCGFLIDLHSERSKELNARTQETFSIVIVTTTCSSGAGV